MIADGTLRPVWLAAGALAGAGLGAALACMDLLFLTRLFDFDHPSTFLTTTGEFVGQLLTGVNVCCCIAGGVAAAMSAKHGPILTRLLRSAVVGGYLGALVGCVDVALFAYYLNLLNSDLVAQWRENRSMLVILNAAAAALASVLGVVSTCLYHVRRRGAVASLVTRE